MLSLLVLLSLASLAQASSVPLSAHGAYAISPAKDPAPPVKSLENYGLDSKVAFRSYAAGDRQKPLMTSETEQKIRAKKQDPKDGFDRTELLFQRFRFSSSVALPGAAKPFTTEQDLSSSLADKPLIVRRKGGDFVAVENLASFRTNLEASVKDPAVRQAVRLGFGDQALPALAAGALADHACRPGLAGKKPGAGWDATVHVEGTSTKTHCEFTGWSSAGDRKVLVVKFTMPKQKTTRKQPNGTPGTVETKGEGALYLEPTSGEMALAMDTEVFAEPTAKEIAEREKRHADIPRNQSFLKTELHATPL